MKFDLSWFTTIPGLLITCGVVLLIVALVIFIVTSKKNKKEKTKDKEVEAAPQDNTVAQADLQQDAPATPIPVEQTPTPTVVEPVPTTTSMPDVTPVMEAAPIVQETPISPVVEPAVASVEPVAVDSNVVQEIAPTVSEEAAPTVVPAPTVEESNPSVETQIAPVSVAAPSVDITPEVSVLSTPEEVVTIPTPTNETASKGVYGGVSEIIPNIEIKPETHQIYGGADPLENTQSMPSVSVQPVETPEPVVTIDSAPAVSIPESPVVIPTVPAPEEKTTQPEAPVIPEVTSGPVGIDVQPVEATAPIMPPEF